MRAILLKVIPVNFGLLDSSIHQLIISALRHLWLFVWCSDVSLGLLTRRFLELLLASPDSSVDLKQATVSMKTCRQRVYDITNILDGISLTQREPANRIKWMWVANWSGFCGGFFSINYPKLWTFSCEVLYLVLQVGFTKLLIRQTMETTTTSSRNLSRSEENHLKPVTFLLLAATISVCKPSNQIWRMCLCFVENEL